MARKTTVGLLAVMGVAGSVLADETVLSLSFEDSDASGWTANGVATIFEGGGNPGFYLGVPYLDFNGISLSAREETSRVFGDLARYGGALRISVDVRVFHLDNFFGDPMDPSGFPLVIQAWNWDIAADMPVSVYMVGPGLPRQEAGWVRMTFDIPDPTATALPAGWGGTGAEDPVTYEPELPPGVTYRDVLAGVGQLDLTTYVPGYFYGPNMWEVGWDNLLIEVVGGGCGADFNGDGFVDFFDYDDFVGCFETGVCPGGRTADFNGDGFADFFDYDDFVGAFESGC